MLKRYLILALILTTLLTFSNSVFAQTKQQLQGITPAPRPLDLGPPKVISFKINNDAATTTSRTVILNNVTERATLFCASERSDLQGAYWKNMHSAPQFILSTGNGAKTVYFQVADSQGRKSSIVRDTINLSTVPDVTTFKVTSWIIQWDNYRNKAFLQVYTENVATNNPTQFRLSGNPNFSDARWFSYMRRYHCNIGKGIGTRTVYLQLKNNLGESKIYNATFNVPSRRDVSICSGYAKSYSQPLGFNFSITPKDVTSRCEMEGRQFIKLESLSNIIGSKCDYTLFGNRLINQGWKFKSFQATDDCSGSGKGYSIRESPIVDSRQIRFKVHLWANPGNMCSWKLQNIILEGPGDAHWKEAFK